MAPFPEGRQTAISIVTVAELEMGVLAAEDEVTRLKRLRTLQIKEASRLIPVARSVANHFAATALAQRPRCGPKSATSTMCPVFKSSGSDCHLRWLPSRGPSARRI